MGEDGAVPFGHDGKGEGTVVVLHHTHVVVALGQRSLSLDVETVGVPCTQSITETHLGLVSWGQLGLMTDELCRVHKGDQPCWRAPA